MQKDREGYKNSDKGDEIEVTRGSKKWVWID
jgi:hypothetical protein